MRFLIPSSLSERNLVPATILGDYLEVARPWLKKQQLDRIWPRLLGATYTRQFRGKNYVVTVAKKIAVFLKLDPSKFTGHSVVPRMSILGRLAGIFPRLSWLAAV
jgi:hypothetical protein